MFLVGEPQSCEQSKYQHDLDGSSRNKQKEYDLVKEEALQMIAENNRNITQLTEVLSRLIDSSPYKAKNINSTYILNKLEQEVRRNTTNELNLMMKHYNFNKVGRFKRAANSSSTCVQTIIAVGTVLGAAGGGALLGGILTMIPVIGTIIGAYFGALLGGVAGANLASLFGKAVCTS